ncbi:hypothetical protein B4U80_09991 [Leptotrombidium deliense]|uniref:Uncharacterized protein n=1 Tax=Leptotrombidium deliense TaxID=299467 RepID=A0A443SUJ7_9ACAR|nr:hypothetical protein B4U80_09991 [Leptotrombidium deliense]
MSTGDANNNSTVRQSGLLKESIPGLSSISEILKDVIITALTGRLYFATVRQNVVHILKDKQTSLIHYVYIDDEYLYEG